MMQPPIDLDALLSTALMEDIGSGDVTSAATLPADLQARFIMRARGSLVACGLVFLPALFSKINPGVAVDIQVAEGEHVAAGQALATLSGPARALLAGERTALNLVQQLSGVATLTARYVAAVKGTHARILDTRKTIPGLRLAQKYAVRCGGGVNHRIGLYDAVLIKDNHIAVAGGVIKAVEAARMHAPLGMMIEVECDTLAQLDALFTVGCDRVLLDNMDLPSLREATARVAAYNAGRPAQPPMQTEASGNVNLETVAAIAHTGVDYISVGKLTHSAPAVDIGLDEV